MSEHAPDAAERASKLADPLNFEFMETPHGSKIHIVGTGLPTSALVLGKRTIDDIPDDAEKALCGVVSEFTPADDIPDDVTGVIDRVCIRCNRHAWRIRDRGKFEEVPL